MTYRAIIVGKRRFTPSCQQAMSFSQSTCDDLLAVSLHKMCDMKLQIIYLFWQSYIRINVSSMASTCLSSQVVKGFARQADVDSHRE